MENIDLEFLQMEPGAPSDCTRSGLLLECEKERSDAGMQMSRIFNEQIILLLETRDGYRSYTGRRRGGNRG